MWSSDSSSSADEVALEQLRHLLEAPRQLVLVLQQLHQRSAGFVGLHQLLMGHHAVEQQRRGIDHVGRRQACRARRAPRRTVRAGRASGRRTAAGCCARTRARRRHRARRRPAALGRRSRRGKAATSSAARGSTAAKVTATRSSSVGTRPSSSWQQFRPEGVDLFGRLAVELPVCRSSCRTSDRTSL